MSNKSKGIAKERKIVEKYRNMGAIAFRMAGSFGPYDVAAIFIKEKLIKLIQSKPNSMSENAKKKLMETNKELNGIFEVEFIVE